MAWLGRGAARRYYSVAPLVIGSMRSTSVALAREPSPDEGLFTLGVVGCGMQLAREQFALIEHLLPIQRGNVSIENLTLLNAILYVAANGCTWRGLPAEYGRWHTVYTRMSRWAKAGILDGVFEELQLLQLLKVRIEVVSLDSTSIKVQCTRTARAP